jgi:hypothetical protein
MLVPLCDDCMRGRWMAILSSVFAPIRQSFELESLPAFLWSKSTFSADGVVGDDGRLRLITKLFHRQRVDVTLDNDAFGTSAVTSDGTLREDANSRPQHVSNDIDSGLEELTNVPGRWSGCRPMYSDNACGSWSNTPGSLTAQWYRPFSTTNITPSSLDP